MIHSTLLARIRRVLRPPRVVAVTRRPAGWFAVSRGRLRDVIAWAKLEDDQVVGLIAGRRGLRPATGRRFHGYLPAAPHSGRDVQLSPPAVSVPVADVIEAIGDPSDTWTSDEHGAIYGRLKTAAENEWATAALRAFIADPNRFLERHFELIVEHLHPAELDDTEREWLASLSNKETAGRRRGEAHDMTLYEALYKSRGEFQVAGGRVLLPAEWGLIIRNLEASINEYMDSNRLTSISLIPSRVRVDLTKSTDRGMTVAEVADLVKTEVRSATESLSKRIVVQRADGSELVMTSTTSIERSDEAAGVLTPARGERP